MAHYLLQICISARFSRALLIGLASEDVISVVAEDGDGVVSLAVSHQTDVSVVGVADEREEEALLLHEGLTFAGELDLAGRVDCGDLLGYHVQDNPV